MSEDDVCRCCGATRRQHEPMTADELGEPAILECPDSGGFVTPDQFELAAQWVEQPGGPVS